MRPNSKRSKLTRGRLVRIKKDVILSVILLGLVPVLRSNGIVVDGDKKEEISPLRNQAKEEASAIDSFNTRTCGMADPNYNEHEFVNTAREGQFPWLVSFQVKIFDELSYKRQLDLSKQSANETGARSKAAAAAAAHKRREDLHFCSGSLISDLWILSAAHCFSDGAIRNYLRNGKLIAVAGSNRVSSRTSLNRNLTIERIYVHSQFEHAKPIGHDIALVELRPESRANFSQRRQRDQFDEQRAPFFNGICLPLKDKRYEFNQSARIAGWGLSRARDVHTMPSKLLTTDLLLWRPSECLKHYEKTPLKLRGDQRQQHHDLLCAGYKKTRDACQSDSGGPLMQYANKKAVAIGIVSYGIGCAKRGVPGLYTRTSAYTDWIRQITTHKLKAKADFKVLESRRSESQGPEVGAEAEVEEDQSETNESPKAEKRERNETHA